MKPFFTLVTERPGLELAESADRAQMLRDYKMGHLPSVRFSATVFTDAPNKNFVILNPDELGSLAESFKGQPFLADHSRKQSDRGGTIVSSQLVDVAGKRGIRQTIDAVKPWAIEGVLDGTVDRFSIGWSAKQYICTVCGTDFMSSDEKHDFWDVGTADKKTGEIVKVLMKGLEGVETSAVTHPAVPGTRTDGVLQQLQQMTERKPSGNSAGSSMVKEDGMFSKILSLLGLPADTAEPEAIKALESRLVPKVPTGLLSALGLGADSSTDEAIAAIFAMKAKMVPKEELDRVVVQLSSERADRLVRKYEGERKITPAMRTWALETATRDAAEFERLMAGFPVIGPELGAPSPAKVEPNTPRSDADDEGARRASGLSAEEWDASKKRVAAQRPN